MAVNQMYVRYMVPAGEVKASVVMVHGGTLTGKSYETTPDGRMGWDEYFVRKGYATYVPDQVARGRSGFDQSSINMVHNGTAEPSTLPNFVRLNADTSWMLFRFGPQPGVPYPDVQYPVEAINELAKQSVPDLFDYPTDYTVKAMADLAVKLDGAVLMGHSQSSDFPVRAALINPAAVKATVVLDACLGFTGFGPALTDEQLVLLKDVPMLGILGDRNEYWAGCQEFIDRFAKLGGRAEVIFPPDLGIHGNTHMIMQDKNNQQIGDLILAWLDKTLQ